MSGQPPFNPGAYEFRPGQQPFVPRGGQQQPQPPNGQQQAYDPYAVYGQQQNAGYQPQYGGYSQYGQQQQGYYPQQQAYVPPSQQQAYVPPGARAQQAYQPPVRSVQGFQPPSFEPRADGGKPLSLSIGGGAPKAAPSLSIGGGAPKAAPSLSIGGGAPKAAPSLSIGGGAPKAAPSLSIGGGAAKTSPAPSLSIGKKAEETKEEPIEEKEVAPPIPAPTPAPTTTETAIPATTAEPKVSDLAVEAPSISSFPAPPESSAPATDAQVRVLKGASGASTPTNFSRTSAKTDADAVYQEQAAAGADAIRDLYGEDIKDPNLKGHLNIIFTGHVDAGKSTMGGQLLYLTGAVDKRTMEKYEQEAKAAGRDTWYLSWALDSGKEERAKGKTVEVGRAYFETEKRRYTILDAPGHKTYVPSMISGAAQADVAMLVLSARKGEFETGFERDGQTREHAVLIKNNGINKLVVVINKMDDPTVLWDQGRYDEIKTKITPFLKSVGFNPKTDLTFIPVSAQMGENMKEPIGKKVAPWYDGPSLLSFLDDMQIMDRNINAPFMLPISEKYNEMGTMVMGKIESGRVKKGDQLLLMPNKSTVEVAGIYTEQAEELEQAFCGDNIRLRLRGVSDEDVSPGFVLTSPTKPIKAVTAFKADLSIIETKNIICGGYSCVLHVHTLAEEVSLTALLHYYDKKTRRKSKKPPQFAKVGMLVSALIETSAPICIERWEDYKMLGRFTLRDEGLSFSPNGYPRGHTHELMCNILFTGKTVAIGKVTKLIERSEDMPDVGTLSVSAS
ncbi:P-loop containing nucleoside triphosphate hydrolase protein [Naematelia encephala]|uniref:Eukaryotic peptide chain release factor GTP-binding subunit n=1 Tax=Naematelia encephala TaxID=71784 RepID=A0A1Y2BG39_9TREE|nr:P-loop containing nucleoside triphosphate hydrolase protein [Naematelia encephala]